MAPRVRAAKEQLPAGHVTVPFRLGRDLLVLRERPVQLRDHVRRTARDLREPRGEVFDVQRIRHAIGSRRHLARFAEIRPGRVVGVFPEVRAVAIAPVDPGGEIPELARRADEVLVRRARRHALHEQLPRRRGEAVGAEEHAVGIEVAPDRRREVAVP